MVPGADVTTPGDPIVAITAVAGKDRSVISTNYPVGQEPDKLIDNTTSKYLNFTKTGAGAIIVPVANGPKTVVGGPSRGFRITTGGDAPERDPLTITIEGTNDKYASSTLHSHWTLLYTGSTGLETDPGRLTAGPLVTFNNSNEYSAYRVLVTSVRDAATATCFQMTEFELTGATAAVPVGTYVVNTLGNNADASPGDGLCADAFGNCGLYTAIQEANLHPGTETIVFAVNGNLNLSATLPDITSDVLIDGPGADILTIRRSVSSGRIFKIANTAIVQMAGITISDGAVNDGAFASAPGEDGGGVYNTGTLHLVSVAIRANRAGGGWGSNSGVTPGGQGGKGGGVFNSGTMTLTNSEVSNNFSGSGGDAAAGTGLGGSGGIGAGIYNSGMLTITNSTVSENHGADGGRGGGHGGSGGGVANDGTIVIANSTIVTNFVGAGTTGINGVGGDILNNASVTLRSTLTNDIAGNLDSEGFSLIQSNVPINETQNPGTNLIGVAAGVQTLAANGGPTKTCALTLASAAIDHGKNFATDFNSGPIDTDQRGELRGDNPNIANATGGDGTDIGAYEITLAVLTVNSLADTDDGSCTENECTLREAINDAVSQSNVITFAVNGTINLTGPLPDLTRNLDINGTGADLLTVRRDTGGQYRIFTIASGVTASMSGLTVTNGHPPDWIDQPGAGLPGGGISNAGSLSLTGVVVTGNVTGANDDNYNNVGGGDGGGIYSTGTLTLTNCTVSNNATAPSHTNWSGGSGGGIYSNGTLTVIGTTVSGNTTAGGAFSFPTGASGGHGGGIYALGTLTLTNSTITGNTTGGGGGGASFGGDGGNGGGIYMDGTTATMTASTIVNNHTGIGGAGPIGAGLNGHGGGTAKFNAGTTTVRNSIVALNTGGASVAGDTADVYGTHVSSGYNLVGVQSGDFTQTGDQAGTIASPLNPMLGALGANGGMTSTHKPLFGSPVIDKGSSFGLTTDQRGTTRPKDDTTIANAADGSDIGSVEIDPPPLVQSITRASSNPANEGTTIAFTVTFNSAVTGVDTTDFALTITGPISGTSIVNVTGSGTTRTVTVNTGAAGPGDGTLRLDVIDDDTITGAGGALGGAGTGNGNFTTGEVYTIRDLGAFNSFVVTKTADTDDGTCNSDCSLREAIAAANADPGPETITFSFAPADPGCISGVCTIDLLTMATDISDVFTALIITGDVTITGSSAQNLIIRRAPAAADQFRIFLTGEGVSATFENMTLRDGYVNDLDGSGGGALLVVGTTATLNHCVLTNNHSGNSTFGGGAIALQPLGSSLVVSDSVLSNNTADKGPGGAISTASSASGNLVSVGLFYTKITGNVAHGRGGGINAPDILNMSDSTVSDNHTAPLNGVSNLDGGGLFSRNLTINGSTIANNYTGDGLANSNFSGGRGGGIFASLATITNSTIAGNHTGKGGDHSGLQAGNGGGGGGIFASFPTTITSTTIVGNYTGAGGAGSPNGLPGNGGGILKVNAALTIRNSIVAANQVPAGASGPDVAGTSAFTSSGYNLVGISNGDFNGPADQVGSAATPLDPQLGPLADNGGVVLTMKPLAGSPVIDHGKNFAAGYLYDERGYLYVRTVDDPLIAVASGGDNTDIGAVELQPPGPTLTATASAATTIALNWTAVPGFTSEVSRNSGPGFAVIGAVGTSNFTDNVTANTAHLYRVRAYSASATTEFSNLDLATAVIFDDDPIVGSTTHIKAVHLTKLRTAVNAVGALAGLGASTFTDNDPSGVKVKPAHILELRSALDSARTILGLTAMSYANSAATNTRVRGQDMTELRNGVK